MERPIKRFKSPGRPVRIFLAFMLVGCLLTACDSNVESRKLSNRAKNQWEAGDYEDSARTFATLVEFHPDSPYVEEAVFLAASLYHHFLDQADLAKRYYLQLVTQFPKSRYLADAKLSLASLYERERSSTSRAAQIYRELIEANVLPDQKDWLQFKLAKAFMYMGKLDLARLEFRNLLTYHPYSSLLAETYYALGYSYYLENRGEMAIAIFRKAIDDFPGTPIASRAQFFIADTLEEQGQLRDALNVFEGLRGRYHSETVLETRINALRGRLKKSVR